MPIALGGRENLAWFHFYGACNDEDVDAYLDSFARRLGEASDDEPFYALVMTNHGDSPSSQQRERIVSMIKAFGDIGQRLPMVVYAFESRFARGVLTAINWMVKKSFDEKVFRTFDQAFAELQSRCPRVDADALWNDISAHVPVDEIIHRA